jgi:hypothetical protein
MYLIYHIYHGMMVIEAKNPLGAGYILTANDWLAMFPGTKYRKTASWGNHPNPHFRFAIAPELSRFHRLPRSMRELKSQIDCTGKT